MMTSLDGRILPDRWTQSSDGGRKDWTATYAAVHEKLAGDAWLVGRVTMAELSPAVAHPSSIFATPPRPSHFAAGRAKPYAIAVDRSGKLHFDQPDIEGDAIVVLLGGDISDAHLAELAADGVSYVVSPTFDIDLAARLDDLGRELGIRRLILEGGGAVNGGFFAARLVDEVSLLIAPTLDGSKGSRALTEFGVAGLKGKAQLSLMSCERLDHGLVHLTYAVRPE
jgi:riboflavin biosynthesis pyrimidine reductase